MLHDLFINATILITVISLGNQIAKDKGVSNNSSLKVKLITGLTSGILGILLMIYSVQVIPTVIVDFRNIPIILAALYSGTLPAVLSSLIIGLFRLFYFGVSYTSVVAFVVALLMGIGCSFIALRARLSIKQKWFYCLLYALIISSIAFTILVKDVHKLIQLLIIYWISVIAVSYVTFMYSEYMAASNRLYRKYKLESVRDYLTDLNNTRQFDSLFNEAIIKAEGHDEKLALLYIDIDHFKRINDTYGHAEGDETLKQIGALLKKACRSFDIVSRVGGEEFTILLLDCSMKEAEEAAERIRSMVENNHFKISKNRTVDMTISVGIAVYPDISCNKNELIKNADTALYKAKQTGRNKVVVYNK
ncbi:MAG: GGDEF domain-containing protein [Bacillota bacterium]